MIWFAVMALWAMIPLAMIVLVWTEGSIEQEFALVNPDDPFKEMK